MATKKTTTKRLRPSNELQTISKDAWYYESRTALDVVVWHPSQGGPGRRCVASVRVPWKLIRESAKRCGWTLTRSPLTKKEPV